MRIFGATNPPPRLVNQPVTRGKPAGAEDQGGWIEGLEVTRAWLRIRPEIRSGWDFGHVKRELSSRARPRGLQICGPELAHGEGAAGAGCWLIASLGSGLGWNHRPGLAVESRAWAERREKGKERKKRRRKE
ncbi:hypothetical protein TIFTF001_053591 [Ficus carica]|uniref:Uncharacterized protein n=1 Tax=Ficus carica TaxID=3494 RepID=A0AA88ELW9_FICCA|nr:hypothetical protein TIFTF001_053591 [Ficus carica]